MSHLLDQTGTPSYPTRYDGYKSFSYLTPGRDYQEFELSPELGRTPQYDLGLTEDEQARTTALLRDSITISLHEHPQVFPADMSEVRQYIRAGRQHTAYEGLSRSGMTAIFDNLTDGIGCITSKAGWKWNDVVYDIAMRRADIDHQDYVRVALRVADLLEAHEQGQLALVLALEASTPIENEVDRIDMLYGLGVRQMGIAYSESNTLGTGLKERLDGGLTAFGRRAVARMNDLGIAIDVSHSSDQTCMDVFERSSKPVLITHAGARKIWPTSRMKPDDVIVACAQTGGVIGIEAAPHTTLSHANPRHSIESVMEHFEYCVDLVGIDHVSFGPDTLYGDHVALHHEFVGALGIHDDAYDGPAYDEVEYVAGIENPTEAFHNIIGWLVKHDYSDDQIRKVIGGNTLRALEQIWV